MAPDTNILIRQILAGILFVFGSVWAIFAATSIRFPDLKPSGALAFWAAGSLIWASWGFIAFTNIKRTMELIAWSFSAMFHAAFIIPLVVHWESSVPMNGLAVIPIWWSLALLCSIAAIVLVIQNAEERA